MKSVHKSSGMLWCFQCPCTGRWGEEREFFYALWRQTPVQGRTGPKDLANCSSSEEFKGYKRLSDHAVFNNSLANILLFTMGTS